jgi:hypothetical protein
MDIQLINNQGNRYSYTMLANALVSSKEAPKFNRIVYSAAHVVSNPLAEADPWIYTPLDWEATLAYRRYLWSLGFGVAEAMDTAQRGMGLDWPTSLALIQRTLQEAKDYPNALVASGCGTDHLEADQVKSVDDVIHAYEHQMEAIEALGGKLIIMASRALVKVAKGPEDYEKVYARIISQAKQPVILHWLGDMFDPALKGYWGYQDLDKATQTALDIIHTFKDKVDGIKVSLLDKEREIAMRRRLPSGVRMYTGDDFNYPELIAGDGVGSEPVHQQSDALLGIFDAIAPTASNALRQLALGNSEGFIQTLKPTLELSRHIFQAPTRFYKTGVVFMAWLNGHQSHFSMVGGQQSARSVQHLCDLFVLADKAGLFLNPEHAHSRMQAYLQVNT